MSDRLDVLRRGWSVLASHDGPRQALRVFPIAEAPRLLRVACTSEGHRAFLVGLGEDERVQVPRSLGRDVAAALVAEIAYFEVGAAVPVRFVHVLCTDRQADQAFEAFCALLWESVEVGSVTEALNRCSDEFRRLLQERAGASASTALGLLGELVVLSRMVERDRSLIAAWTGPLGARHDFVRKRVALETKTTLRSEARGRRVKIADIDQLEPPALGSLYLCLVRLEQAMDGTLSIASLVDSIASRLAASDATAFRSTVDGQLKHGVAEGRFQLRELVAYRVGTQFPGLTPNKLVGGRLDAGVSHVTYDLDLEAAAAFEVPFDSAIDSLAGAYT